MPAPSAGVTADIGTKCVSIAPCKPVNAVVVDQTAVVQTAFSRIFGIGSITVHAHAVACAPCEPKKVDIMLVLDKTGSMCQDSWGRQDDACTDLNNARNGIKTFLGYLEGEHAGREYLVADTFTLADVSVACQLVNLRHAGVAVDATQFPRVAAWFERVGARPSLKALVDQDQGFLARLSG